MKQLNEEFERDYDVEIEREVIDRYAQAAIDTINFEQERELSEKEYCDTYMDWTKEAEDELESLEEDESL